MADYRYSRKSRERLKRLLSDKLREIFYASNYEKCDLKALETELQSGIFQGYKTEWQAPSLGDANGFWKIFSIPIVLYELLYRPQKEEDILCLILIFTISEIVDGIRHTNACNIALKKCQKSPPNLKRSKPNSKSRTKLSICRKKAFTLGLTK